MMVNVTSVKMGFVKKIINSAIVEYLEILESNTRRIDIWQFKRSPNYNKVMEKNEEIWQCRERWFCI